MSKWSNVAQLRYQGFKAVDAFVTTAKAVLSQNVAIGDVFESFQTKFQEPITWEMRYSGKAMEPTFKGPAEGKTLGEKLLLRKLRAPSPSSVFAGDVVAVKVMLEEQEKVLIRRVAAQAGDEMVSDNAADEAFYLPEGTCWVEADNEKLKPDEAMDSRYFGPIDYENIIGRAMYFYRSDVDHGSVENSEEAMDIDEPVLLCELDLEELGRNTNEGA
mmetsp:Transcript_38195/g.83076  ORF Transcript_38195/g.83076 Transcript_38195/m.83076 type:complete len:216 (-) Transcript_38195:314-961(-)|eukprot:CAMPEP_0118941036 /NCGR_PEP_ID=MMETSP1169-20130426/32908_1 /TAXON_ID=36882 /ORGANISM="Pyramimonas obovata, Strain CCMP722" /LENGTH=215 /DNA_ID=CAMNT_0006885687 /DNA_START=99 /DNA_END=746 /DNA_ORIENTATION=-